MDNARKLRRIKLLHTAIWLGYCLLILYMLYLVLAGQLGMELWIGYILVGLEVIVLCCFRFVCPLTIIARRYSNSTRSNFDIFLPEWLARHNKVIFTFIILIIIALTILKY